EQEVFHNKPYSFNIPYNIDDLTCKNDDNKSKLSNIKDDSKILSKVLENIQLNSNNNIQNEYEKETIQQIKKNNAKYCVTI
ncbi:hypothetical protein C1645_883032, partial [Glomus cerebriforme]